LIFALKTKRADGEKGEREKNGGKFSFDKNDCENG
jgi:hypothetical protein